MSENRFSYFERNKMRTLVVLFYIFLLNGCFIYSSSKAWEEEMKMIREANGRSICMKYEGKIHVMYYCENDNKK